MSAAGSRLQAVGSVWSINSRIPDKAISGIYHEMGEPHTRSNGPGNYSFWWPCNKN
jgi:hypothetical protein